MRIDLIRVRTVENIEAFDKHGPLIEKAFPGLQAKCYSIEDQPYGIHDEESQEIARPKVINLAKELKGADAIIISCAGDPGVSELKKELPIPVIGAGESLAHVSRTLGNSVGVITITDGVPDVVKRELGKDLLCWKKVEGVKTGLDLELEASYENTLNAARQLVMQGSNVIALACTGFSTIGIAPEIGKELGLPVVDPVLAAGSMAYNLMLNREGWNMLKIDRE
jgi:Asp/Glu/hydantoin racemase